MTHSHFFKSIEGSIFLLGCFLLIGELLGGLIFGSQLSEELLSSLLLVITADLFGGRGAGISLGLEMGLSQFRVISISVIFDLTLLFIFYPLFSYSYEHLVMRKFVGRLFDATKKAAEKYQAKIEGWGAVGIIFFVWIPLHSTGPLVGAIIGSLIGMRMITVICIVIVGIISSAVSWTFAFDYLFKFTEGIGKIIPAMFVGLIFGMVLFYRIRQFYHATKHKTSTL